ncbi:glycoside hydrolase family 15 protein [Nakamurella flavida]|uniref:Glycoside hydrolase family 15 protein n=1 Tax=Nakamurella flavida TaxID=363630 RepID=A0A938YQ03_9ACTN|nr:glycoside hydrolase family 15 protein [Nakamurella flavida]MBM9477357.1 glycoside hydrolase family 15 protein [Nakamurella flavida]MDP9777289.1 GH15 family glucan-1,4-alpha-glucosidase [Nakamurella flavida]
MITLPPASETVDGYPRIEDHALIGDGVTAALVGTDGAIRWLCLPRFDGPALFASLLDRTRGGEWTLRPADDAAIRSLHQEYLTDTAVTRTVLTTDTGTVEILDALTVDSAFVEHASSAVGELVRLATVTDGAVELRTTLSGRGGVQADGDDRAVSVTGAGSTVRLTVTREVPGLADLDGRVTLTAGESVALVLRWADGPTDVHSPDDARAALDRTAQVWRDWAECIDFTGRHVDLVRRSAVTLKLCDFPPNGAIVAAPTASLPEAIGGERNWDYRFTWVRDAAYTVYALRRIGLSAEADGFLEWVLDNCMRHQRPHLLYTLDGEPLGPETEDPDLEGYRGSPPVRWGNGAADQIQHDVYGEILDCAWQFVRAGGELDDVRWEALLALGRLAEENWRTPDHGIWEIRDTGRPFTYSVAMCQVAADRLSRIAETTGRTDHVAHWRELSDTIRAELLERAFDEDSGIFNEHLDEPGTLDSSLLALPLRRVVAKDDPRMAATTRAVAERLAAGTDTGLLYRYLHTESPDGLEGEEGSFLLCSFWWVDNLVGSGEFDRAQALFDSLCARVNHVGLLPEQIDPHTDEFLGNFPQAFSHIGLISSAVNLERNRPR